MKRWLMALAVALVPVILAAQAVPRVYWEHDGLNLTHFNCVIDGTTTSALGLLTPDSGTTYSIPVTSCSGVMVTGTHTLVIQACNANGCTPATAITVVKL